MSFLDIFRKTPLPPCIPAVRGKGVRKPRERSDAPLRRTDGDAVRFLISSLDYGIFFPFFLPLIFHLHPFDLSAEAGEGTHPALRRRRQRAYSVVPVVQPVRRQDCVEPHPGLRRETCQASGIAAAGSVGVRRGN